jgi:hypothetical protein
MPRSDHGAGSDLSRRGSLSRMCGEKIRQPAKSQIRRPLIQFLAVIDRSRPRPFGSIYNMGPTRESTTGFLPCNGETSSHPAQCLLPPLGCRFSTERRLYARPSSHHAWRKLRAAFWTSRSGGMELCGSLAPRSGSRPIQGEAVPFDSSDRNLRLLMKGAGAARSNQDDHMSGDRE